MRLLVAWVASAFAGAAAIPVGGWVAAWFLGGGPMVWAMGMFRIVPIVFVGCLIVQFVYGGLLYLGLGYLGLFNLPVVVLAYVVPIAAFVWMGADVPKDIVMAIPKLACGLGLAVVGWMLAPT